MHKNSVIFGCGYLCGLLTVVIAIGAVAAPAATQAAGACVAAMAASIAAFFAYRSYVRSKEATGPPPAKLVESRLSVASADDDVGSHTK